MVVLLVMKVVALDTNWTIQTKPDCPKGPRHALDWSIFCKHNWNCLGWTRRGARVHVQQFGPKFASLGPGLWFPNHPNQTMYFYGSVDGVCVRQNFHQSQHILARTGKRVQLDPWSQIVNCPAMCVWSPLRKAKATFWGFSHVFWFASSKIPRKTCLFHQQKLTCLPESAGTWSSLSPLPLQCPSNTGDMQRPNKWYMLLSITRQSLFK